MFKDQQAVAEQAFDTGAAGYRYQRAVSLKNSGASPQRSDVELSSS